MVVFYQEETMSQSEMLKHAISLVFLVFVPLVRCQYSSPPDLPPLCMSEVALANSACSRLPYRPLPPISPPDRPRPLARRRPPPPPPPTPRPQSFPTPSLFPNPSLPTGLRSPPPPSLICPPPGPPFSSPSPSPLPSPSASAFNPPFPSSPFEPNPPSPHGDDGLELESGHGNRRYRQTPEERECCRWLRAIDAECICGMLISLPPLLSKAQHDYRVTVDESCVITFQCAGRLRVI